MTTNSYLYYNWMVMTVTAREPLDNDWNSKKQKTKADIDPEVEEMIKQYKFLQNTIDSVDTSIGRQHDVVVYDKRSGSQKVVSGDIIRIDAEDGLRIYLDSGYYMFFPNDVARKLFDAMLPKITKEVLS